MNEPIGNSLPFLPPLFPEHCKGPAPAPRPSRVAPLGPAPDCWPASSPTGFPTAFGVWQDGNGMLTISSLRRPLEPQSTEEEGWTDGRASEDSSCPFRKFCSGNGGEGRPEEERRAETGPGAGMPVGRGSDHPGHCPEPLPTAADGLAGATATSESPAWRDQAVGHRATPEDMPSWELGSVG